MSGFINRRQSISARKLMTEEPGNRHIRFDYSDIYIDNEDLDTELEDQESKLKREQFRKTKETEENYRKAKQNADTMLWLKNALKHRDPNESSNRISKSATLSRKSSSKQISFDDLKINDDEKSSRENDADIESRKDMDDNDGMTETDSKPKSQLGNLTMFLLSLQKLKGCGLRQKRDKQDKSEEQEESSNNKLPKQNSSQKKPTRSSSLKYFPTRRDDIDKRQGSAPPTNKRSSSQYGIHVKKDFTRSRRELEEISRLEQNAKYGCVNKYEERRIRLLDSCKNTDNLKQRIREFLKNVEEFKKDTCNVNSEEKVLYRSRSAHMTRPEGLW